VLKRQRRVSGSGRHRAVCAGPAATECAENYCDHRQQWQDHGDQHGRRDVPRGRKETLVAGNISPAVLDVLLQRKGKHPDIWVLELSSFQLETTASLNADAATVLNISEDHMDRYSDMGEYIAAKARIFRADESGGVQVLNS